MLEIASYFMPSRRTPLINGCYYHIYNRVKDHRKLFLSHDDYILYLTLWKEVDFSPSCRLFAYCLMPNHYHYLLQIVNAELFSKKISYFLNRYLKRIGQARKETGAYFTNRFHAKYIYDEHALIAVCCYIHLNPLKAHLVTELEQWPYSNYLEFMGKRQGTLWDQTLFGHHIQSSHNYEAYMKTRYTEESLSSFCFEQD